MMIDHQILSNDRIPDVQKPDAGNTRIWQVPKIENTKQDVAYLAQRSLPPQRSTIVFKAHKPSRWKTDTVLNTLVWGHNLVAQIYAACGSPGDSNTAFNILGLIAETEAAARERIVQKQRGQAHGPGDDGNEGGDEDAEQKVRFLANDLATMLRSARPYTNDDIHYQRVYEGYTRKAASAVLSWRQKIIKAVAEELGKPRNAVTLDDIQEVYHALIIGYQIAAATRIPYGRNRDERLDRFGKREARWLLDHLLPKDEIQKLLQAIDALLDDEQRAVNSRAAVVAYRGKRMAKADHYQATHAVRESYVLQRLHERYGDPVLLGSFHRKELETLAQELKTVDATHAEVRAQLEDIRGQLQVTHAAVCELRGLEDVLRTYLYKKPPSFPTLDQVDLSEERRRQNYDTYQRWFSWFLIDPKTPGGAQRFLDIDQEHKEVQGLLKAGKQLRPPQLQPLPFIGTMRPGQWRDFALTYDRDTGDLILAVILHRRGIDIHGDRYHADQAHPSRQQQRTEYQRRRTERPLSFVNAPETPFCPPDDVPVILFPLEYGAKRYHKQVKDIITRQRQAQQRYFEQQQAEKPGIDIADCFPPDVPLKSARLVCKWTDDETPEFYIHIAVEQDISSVAWLPSSILAVSEVENGYYWTLLDLAGRQRSDSTQPRAGKLLTPTHVDPANGARRNSSNYIYETAKAIVNLAEQHQAIIAIQDTRWKKQRPGVDRGQNRRIFRRPSGRVMDAVTFKAVQRGLMKPYSVANVSPVRDCAQCQRGLAKNAQARTTWYEWRIACPGCGATQALSDDKITHECISCQHQWEPQIGDEWYEQRFTCPRCQSASISASHNIALVTGQKALIAIEKHAKNARRTDRQRAERMMERALRATSMGSS
jgi:hypothetical protein